MGRLGRHRGTGEHHQRRCGRKARSRNLSSARARDAKSNFGSAKAAVHPTIYDLAAANAHAVLRDGADHDACRRGAEADLREDPAFEEIGREMR
jgi:hypothetical protein